MCMFQVTVCNTGGHSHKQHLQFSESHQLDSVLPLKQVGIPMSGKFLSAKPGLKKPAGTDGEFTACLAFCKEFAIQLKMRSTGILTWWRPGILPP